MCAYAIMQIEKVDERGSIEGLSHGAALDDAKRNVNQRSTLSYFSIDKLGVPATMFEDFEQRERIDERIPQRRARAKLFCLRVRRSRI